jgi:hypothetical protein
MREGVFLFALSSFRGASRGEGTRNDDDGYFAGFGPILSPCFAHSGALHRRIGIIVLPDHPPVGLGIYALYAPNRFLAAKTRVFVDFLSARFGDKPEWDRF